MSLTGIFDSITTTPPPPTNTIGIFDPVVFDNLIFDTVIKGVTPISSLGVTTYLNVNTYSTRIEVMT